LNGVAQFIGIELKDNNMTKPKKAIMQLLSRPIFYMMPRFVGLLINTHDGDDY